MDTGYIALAILAAIVFLVFLGAKTVPQGYEFTVERFGKYTKSLRPGFNWITPIIESIGARVNVMEQVLDIPEQQVISQDNATVTIDGSEIHEAQWIAVSDAIAQHECGELAILPPTYFSLLQISGYADCMQLMASLANKPCVEQTPVFGFADEQVIVMFEGDAGFEKEDAAIAGPRNRAVLIDQRWHYLFDHGDSRLAVDGR